MVTPSIHTYFHVTEPMNKDCFAFEGPLLIPILSDFQSDVRRGVPLYSYNVNRLVQFSSVQSFERLGHWGDIRNDSTQIISQSFLQEALSSSSHMGGDVHSSFCPSGISSADCECALKDGFGKAMWHATS